jgi:hypothetical protein
MKTIEATATTPASRDAVWALLADASKWTEWGSWSEAGVEGGGPQGPGSVRVLRKWPYRLRELVTDWEPGRKTGYELLDGMPVTGYRATVTLEDAPGGGTLIRWRSTYERARPTTAVVLRLAVRDTVRRLAKAAGAAR